MDNTAKAQWESLLTKEQKNSLLNRLSIEGFNTNASDFSLPENFNLNPSSVCNKKALYINSYEVDEFDSKLATELGVEKIFVSGSKKLSEFKDTVNIYLAQKDNLDHIGKMDYIDCHFLSFLGVDKAIEEFNEVNICINLSHPHNSGASIVQEFVYALNFLDKFIQSEIKINNLLFVMPIDSLLMANIAKIRSFKFLVDTVLEANNINQKYEILGTCSLREQTLYDPYNNMLRNTTSIMGQIFGGSDYISVTTFDNAFSYLTQEPSSSNAYRNAINTMNVLVDESKLNFFDDISQGSFTIENLCASLIKETWESFINWNQRDFFLEFNQFVESVRAISKKRFENINYRKTLITGVTKFSNPEDTIEKLYKSKWAPVDLQIGKFPLRRNAYQFENLRILTENLEHKLECVIYYHEELKVVNARLSFTRDILEILNLNIKLKKVKNFDDIEFDKTSDINIFCSTENDYKFSDALPDVYLVGPGADEVNRIYSGMNVYKFLENILTKIGVVL